MEVNRASSHIVGSLYTFSEAAGHEMVSLFNKENSIPGKSCHFNDGNLFTIHGSHNDDESLAYLVNSMANLISAEKDKDLDPFEDAKIVRQGGTHPSLTLAALIGGNPQANRFNREVPLIEHENIIRKWSPTSEIEDVGSKLSSELLGRVESLCGCRFEQASDSADLWIKADREQDIAQAMVKLTRLNKMIVDEMSFPRIHSFCILEGETSVSLRLIALGDLNDTRLVTTLLPKHSVMKPLRDLCVLVLVKGSNIVEVRLQPATSGQLSHLWNDHVSDCCQAQGLVGTKAPIESKNAVDKWVSEIAVSRMQMDVFPPESGLTSQQSMDVGTVCKDSLSPTKKQNTRRARVARGKAEASYHARIETQGKYDSKEAETQESVTSFKGFQSLRNVSARKAGDSDRQPPSIEPPCMASLIMPSHSLPTVPSKTSQQPVPSSPTRNVVDSKSGSLIDMSVQNEKRAQSNKPKDQAATVIGSLQNTAKVKARDSKFTANQSKGSTQSVAEGYTALIKSFEENSVHLLALALPRIGRIELAVDIGRLLINQQCVSPDFKTRSFKMSEFSSIFRRERIADFKTMFTNKLTARSFEAESIVNILLSQGRRLFQQQPASRKVTHVFDCKAKCGDQIAVEFYETGKFNIHGSEVLLGALDWHFPKRSWDARLRLTSQRFLATDYQRQASDIIKSLKIDPSRDGQTLELWVKTTDENLSIETITLRRETLHPCTIHPDLVLHMTECQDLQVRQPSDSRSIYSGSIQRADVMVKTNRLWWEAKITSINAAIMLKGNLGLELGEVATWSPSSVVDKGVVRDLFAVANEIVTRIDYVGFFNRDKGSSGSKTSEKASEKTLNVQSNRRKVDLAFW